MQRVICFISLLFSLGFAGQVNAAIDIDWPTENRALLYGDEERFFQPTISKRLISGKYGFVRTSQPEPARFFERFHEGIDIAPLRRDAKGEPLDPVKAVAAGKVIYVNTRGDRSNYGIYVIIEHRFDGWPMYGLYSHLANHEVRTGQEVRKGQQLGLLGYTGSGINQERAHLHFEMTFRITRDFSGWFEKAGVPLFEEKGPNHHGDHSGLAYLGVDPAPLLLASAAGRPITVPQVFANEPVQFKVRVPSGGKYWYWQRQFPFQVVGGVDIPPPPAWEMSCNRIGIPLSFKRLDVPVAKAELSWFRPGLSLQEWFTRGLVEGRGGHERLSKHGHKWISQLTWD
ncbi:MAG: M23 family metallopeptidase [Candidatus Methylacidiphilales bacterium]